MTFKDDKSWLVMNDSSVFLSTRNAVGDVNMRSILYFSMIENQMPGSG